MGVSFHSTVLITDNFEEMKRFYMDVLGQRSRFDLGNYISFECALTLWELKDEYPITKALGTKHHPSTNNNLEICFETDDFDSDLAQLKEHGVRPVA